MPLAKDMTNQAKQDFPVDAILNGGESMRNKESLQTQIALAPERALAAKLIKGWPNGKGGTYDTSMLDHMVYLTQYCTRIEGALAAQGELLKQIAGALTNGVDLQIDYARIDASIKAAMPEIPEYELTKKEQ